MSRRAAQRAEARAGRTCPVCGEPFEAQRSTKVYCSTGCRVAADRAKVVEAVQEKTRAASDSSEDVVGIFVGVETCRPVCSVVQSLKYFDLRTSREHSVRPFHGGSRRIEPDGWEEMRWTISLVEMLSSWQLRG